jgi:hypothetical protein
MRILTLLIMLFVFTFDPLLGVWGFEMSVTDNELTNIRQKLELTDSAARLEGALLDNHNTSHSFIISRLLFLFLLDFVNGIDLAVLSFKDKRNKYFRPGVYSDETRKFIWAMCVGLDCLWIGFTLYFAGTASRNAQYAWCVTFALWLLIEVLFVSSCVALWTHVWLPSFSHHSIQKIRHHIQRYLTHDEKQGQDLLFNAAAHFFVSQRLATSLVEIESRAKDAVLRFSTEWPREQFVVQGVVPKGSDESGPWYHFVRFCVSMRQPELDMLVWTVISLILGCITVLLGIAYQIYPSLTLVLVAFVVGSVVIANLIGVHSILKSDSVLLRVMRSTMTSFGRDFQSKSSIADRTTTKEKEWQYSVPQCADGDYFDHYGSGSELVVGGENDMFMSQQFNGTIVQTKGTDSHIQMTNVQSSDILLGDYNTDDVVDFRSLQMSKSPSDENVIDEGDISELGRLSAQPERLSSVLARL